MSEVLRDGKGDQKVALITGSSAGIGEKTAEGFSEDGYAVVINARTLERARAVADRLNESGHTALPIAADMSSPEQIDAMFRDIDRAFGRVDVLVNNAAAVAVTDSATYELKKWEKILALNLSAPFLCSQHAALSMRRTGGGVIVNIASVYAGIAAPMRAAYVTTKHGLLGLTKVLATEWAPDNIRVMAVAPSYIATEMIDRAIAMGQFNSEAVLKRTPLGRLGTPSEVADVIRFIASDGARYMTGSTAWVDGGWMAFGGG